MRIIKISSLLIFAAAGLHACASAGVDRQLDERLAQESDVRTRADLDKKTSALLKGTPGLDAAQRARMEALKSRIRSRLRELNDESRKLRELLVQDVLSPDDKAGEILALKSRMRANSKAKLDSIFGAVDNANDVLGRNLLLQEGMDLQRIEDEASF